MFGPKCNHEWEQIVDKKFDPPHKEFSNTMGIRDRIYTGVVILACKKCGKLDKTYV